jgi:hypothetical protein
MELLEMDPVQGHDAATAEPVGPAVAVDHLTS